MFEEQIASEQVAAVRHMDPHADSFPEALSYFPRPEEFTLGPDEYLEQVRKIKSVVAVPVIGSLNGATRGGWLGYARLIEQAGADALELNVYSLSTSADDTGEDVERRALEILEAVKQAVRIPVIASLKRAFPRRVDPLRAADRAGGRGRARAEHLPRSGNQKTNLKMIWKTKVRYLA